MINQLQVSIEYIIRLTLIPLSNRFMLLLLLFLFFWRERHTMRGASV